MVFTVQQQVTLAIVPKISAFASLCGSSAILTECLYHDRRKLKRVYHRLLCVMSVYDVIESTFNFMTSWPIPKGTPNVAFAIGNQQSCTAQGFVLQFGLAIPILNLCLGLYYLLVIRYSWTESMIRTKAEPYFHASALIVALGTCFASLQMDLFNNSNLWCWIAPLPQGCKDSYRFGEEANCVRGDNAWIYRWAFYFVPLWICIFALMGAMFVVYATVRNLEKASSKYKYDTSRFAAPLVVDENGKTIKPPKPPASKSRRVAIQAMWYVGVFYLTFTFATGTRVTQQITGKTHFWMLLFHTIFEPAQGFLNYIVYVRPRYITYREKNPKASVWHVLISVVTRRGEPRVSMSAPQPSLRDSLNRAASTILLARPLSPHSIMSRNNSNLSAAVVNDDDNDDEEHTRSSHTLLPLSSRGSTGNGNGIVIEENDQNNNNNRHQHHVHADEDEEAAKRELATWRRQIQLGQEHDDTMRASGPSAGGDGRDCVVRSNIMRFLNSNPTRDKSRCNASRDTRKVQRRSSSIISVSMLQKNQSVGGGDGDVDVTLNSTSGTRRKSVSFQMFQVQTSEDNQHGIIAEDHVIAAAAEACAAEAETPFMDTIDIPSALLRLPFAWPVTALSCVDTSTSTTREEDGATAIAADPKDSEPQMKPAPAATATEQQTQQQPHEELAQEDCCSDGSNPNLNTAKDGATIAADPKDSEPQMKPASAPTTTELQTHDEEPSFGVASSSSNTKDGATIGDPTYSEPQVPAPAATTTEQQTQPHDELTREECCSGGEEPPFGVASSNSNTAKVKQQDDTPDEEARVAGT